MSDTRPIETIALSALFLSCMIGVLRPAPAAAQSPSKIKVTIRPLLIRAPIFGAEIDLPKLPSAPPTPGGGDDGSEVSGTTDVSLNAAYMAEAEVSADRWFGEFSGLWAAVSADRTAPRINISTDTRFYSARGGVRLFHGLYATVGVKRATIDIDATLTLPLLDKTIQGSVSSKGLWDPMIGAEWRTPLGDNWSLEASFQGGGFGVGTDVDLASEVVVDWHLKGPIVLRAGYSTLYYKYTVADVHIGQFQRTLISKQSLNGPVLGFGLEF